MKNQLAMKLTDLIGKKISKIRFNYQFENKHGRQEFQSQIRLSNKQLVLIPNHPDLEYDLIEHHANNQFSSFLKAKRCGLTSRLLFKNKEILDIHFRFRENEPFKDSRAILELENEKFITENNIDPQGLEDIDLIILNKSQFQDLASDGIEIRSLKNNILKS